MLPAILQCEARVPVPSCSFSSDPRGGRTMYNWSFVLIWSRLSRSSRKRQVIFFSSFLTMNQKVSMYFKFKFTTECICGMSSRSLLSHAHRFMGFFRNQNGLPADSPSPTTYSVSDNIVGFTPVPTPSSHSFLFVITRTQVHVFFFGTKTTFW